MRKKLSKMFPISFKGSHMQNQIIGVDRATTSHGHNLLLQSDLIRPLSPGIYHLMPMLQKVVEKLTQLIDSKLQDINCEKVQLSILAPKTLLDKTGRWDQFGDELIKTRIKNRDFCLCPTHEESLCDIVGSYSRNLSPQQLPIKWYQITNKYRSEADPKHGLLRCREFLMKDLYTFDASIQDALKTYEEVGRVYKSLFDDLEMEIVKVKAESGLIGGDLSHEYHLISEVGEDKVAFDKNGQVVNVEGSKKIEDYDVKNAIELGHTFFLGTKYSKVMNVTFKDDSGAQSPCEMGCYGLGVTRIIAACVEKLSIQDGMRWPRIIAPYKVCFITPREGSSEFEKALQKSHQIYDSLNKDPFLKGDLILDDRHKKTIGWRLKHSNLLGFPLVVVLGKHLVDDKVEVIEQSSSSSSHLIPVDCLHQFIINYFDKNIS